jgi:hypothetical protein
MTPGEPLYLSEPQCPPVRWGHKPGRREKAPESSFHMRAPGPGRCDPVASLIFLSVRPEREGHLLKVTQLVSSGQLGGHRGGVRSEWGTGSSGVG